MKVELGNVWKAFGWAFLAVVTCIFVGCKKEDTDPPAVALSAPTDGFTIVAASHFTITGVASDDQGLVSITASLHELGSDALVQSATTQVSGLSDQFDLDMAAGDRYTSSGTYTLKVTAYDGAQNFGSAFTQVQIQALPLSYQGAVWAGDQGSGSFGIHRLDTAGLVTAGPSGLANLADLLADNRNGQLVGVQSTPGWLRAWNLQDLSSIFQFDLPQGTGSATYTGISMNQSRYFGALQVPDYVRSYRFDGTEVNGFEQSLHPATAILGTSDRVYVGLQGVVGLPMKLDAYEASSGALSATLTLDWPAMGILSVSDAQLLVWGNDGAIGKLLLVDPESMSVTDALTVGETMVGACTANGRAWVLTDQGLYEFFPSSATLSAQLVAGSYAAIAVDATLNRILLGGQDAVEIRGGAGALLETISGSFGQVKFIELLYNR